MVILHDEQPRPGHFALRLAGYSGRRVPWGVRFGGPDQCRFCKDLSLQPVSGARGYRLDLASEELLRLGLQLERELDRHARYRQRQLREQICLPKLWAAFEPADAASITGDGPELAAYAARTGGHPQCLLEHLRRDHSGLVLQPFPWVSHHWQRAGRCSPIWRGSPQGRYFTCNTCPTIWSATTMPPSSTSGTAAFVKTPSGGRAAQPSRRLPPGNPRRASARMFPSPSSIFKENDSMARILLINNDGGGFADYVEVADGTTVQPLFAERVPHGKPQDYLIRVNRQPVAADQVLVEGDRVSLTPTKIEGALA